MNSIEKLSQNERITVRRPGPPDAEGKCRYVSLASTGRKFDSKRYIEPIAQLARGAHVG
jgi:hypothetical protein